MPLTLRRATNADIADVVRVIRSVYDEYGFSWDEGGYHADLYDIEGSYDAVGDSFYVAELDGQVIGTVALELFEGIPGEEGITVHNGYWRVCGADFSLERLYVDPFARRVGAGRALLEHVMNEARAQGRTAMELWSDKNFTDAHRLYQRYGAVVVGERLCDDPEQSPEWGLLLKVGEKSNFAN